MFCIKCGSNNSDEAVYCQKCGSLLEAEEETRVAKKEFEKTEIDESEEKQVFAISPTLKFVKVGYGLAVLGAILLVALLTVISTNMALGLSWWIYVLLGFSLLLIPAYYHFRQKMIRYRLTDSKIEIDEGFVFQNSRNIPLRSIQDVSVSSSITQRMLGFGDVVIDNASEDGGKIVLKNIDTPKKYADVLLKQMRLLNK